LHECYEIDKKVSLRNTNYTMHTHMLRVFRHKHVSVQSVNMIFGVLGVVAEEESESRYGWNHFLGRPCFKQKLRANVCIGTTGEILRGVKSNRVLREVYAVLRTGGSSGVSVVMTESGRVRPNLKYRSSVSVEESARRRRRTAAVNSLCPPECFALSFIHETVPNVFPNLRNVRGVSSLAHLKFVRFSRIRTCARVSLILRSFCFPYMCLWERGRFLKFKLCSISHEKWKK